MDPEQNPGAEEGERTLRDDIEAAVAQVETDYAATDDGGPERGEAEEAGQESAPEAAGGEGTADSAAQEPGDGEAAATSADDRGGDAPAYPDDAERYPNLEQKLGKAPAKWRPGAREGWDQLPERVRREIHRRELDLDRMSRDTAETRHFHRDVMKVLAPHEDIMRKEGAKTPVEAIAGLVNTAVVLERGTPEQKAARAVQLITHYGIDIKTLDGALAAHYRGNGGAPPAAAASSDVSAELDKRLGPIQEFMQGLQERMNEVGEETAQAARSDIETFREQAEFLDDVRTDMADMLERAADAGRPLTLQQAYDAACHLNPEIREILAQRAAQGAQSRDTVRDKVARSEVSLTGRRSGTGPGKQSSGSLREDLERAFDEVTGGG